MMKVEMSIFQGKHKKPLFEALLIYWQEFSPCHRPIWEVIIPKKKKGRSNLMVVIGLLKNNRKVF